MLKVLNRRTWLVMTGLGLGVIVLFVFGFFFLISGNNSQPISNTLQSGANPTGAAATVVSKENGQEYLALGDSVAFGVGASSPQELGYPAVFYRQYLTKARPEVTVYKNLAIPGETATTFISRPKAKSQLDMALAELAAGQSQKTGPQVSLISLTIGGNDVLAARTKSQAEKEAVLNDFDANLQKILAAFAPYTRDGPTQLILTTYYNPFGTGEAGLSSDDTVWMQQFNALIKQRAAEYKAKAADFFPPILGQEKNLTWISGGDIHPNTAGHVALAGALWQATGYTLPAALTFLALADRS